MTSEVLPATDGVIADAISVSRLRDGRPFDPRLTALVLEGAAPASRYQHGGTVDVVSIADSRIEVNATSPGGGFVVLSEAYYPGWQVRIDDGAPQPVVRADLALQGVSVPTGRHVVTFEFVSHSRRLGLALGAAGLLALAATALAGWRTSRP